MHSRCARNISHFTWKHPNTKWIIASINQFLWTYGKRFNINTWRRRETSGDDRRASVSKKTRPRRASTAAPRKDSVRPVKADVKQTQKIIEETQELEQARRHRRIAMIVLGTFIFLLVASVLVVVITLTQSSFLSPASSSKELAERNRKSWNLKVWILTPSES